jgi:peroxiredoxin
MLALLMLTGFVRPVTAAKMLLHRLDDRPPAMDFKLSDLDGKPHALSDYRGKIVLVNFWATWCPPCRAEIPSMQRAWRILKEKNVVMLAVHVGGTEDKVWTFLTDFGIEFPVLLDADATVSRAWLVRGLPVTYIIDPEGRMAMRAIGGREWDDTDLIEQILSLGQR